MKLTGYSKSKNDGKYWRTVFSNSYRVHSSVLFCLANIIYFKEEGGVWVLELLYLLFSFLIVLYYMIV